MSQTNPTSKKESPVVFNLRQIVASDIARWDIRNHIAAAADEIERLEREIAHRDDLEKFTAPLSCATHGLVPNLGLFQNKCPACERDRLQAALVKHGAHAAGCSNQRNVGDCSCGLWAALSGEPAPKRAYYETHEPPHCPTCDCGSAHETAAERAVAAIAETIRGLTGARREAAVRILQGWNEMMRGMPASPQKASGEPADAEKRAMGADLDSRDHEAR